jgi:predicted phage tail protein
MNTNEIAQHFHDAFTEVAQGLSAEMAGQVAPEEIVRALMMGAASFTAATWAASTKASGVDHALTRLTMTTALHDFYGQAVIPQTMRA